MGANVCILGVASDANAYGVHICGSPGEGTQVVAIVSTELGSLKAKGS